ncbi:hypothetical protein M3J09_001333 [Ascochyta lentis]
MDPANGDPSERDGMLSPPTAQPGDSVRTLALPDGHAYKQVPEADHSDRLSQAPTTDDSMLSAQENNAKEHRAANTNGMLTRKPFYWWFSVPMDVALALTPLFFLIIAGICLSLNNKRTSKYGEDIKAITLVLPTIFPIVYAAILGKILRRVALFKAERSTTVGTVERLIGCQSLFSTFERQFAFQRVDVLGIALLVAWLLSPLGGQSSLRLLANKPLFEPVNDTVRYYPVEGYGKESHITNLGYATVAWPLYAPLYMTALLTSRQYLDLPMDQFGNIKIPDIFQLQSYSASLPPDTWFDIDENSIVEYSSIIGIPIVGVPESGNVSFNLVSHYWSVQCEKLATTGTLTNATLTRRPSFDMIPGGSSPNNMNNATSFTYQSRWITSEGPKNGTHGRPVSGSVSATECLAYPLVVESKIACQGRSCAVKAMRRLPRSTEDIIGNFEASSVWLMTITANMPGADQGILQDDNTSSELVEHWMMDPNLSTFRWDKSQDRSGVERRWVNVAELPMDLFSHRLQTAMNTFWQSTIGSAIMMGNLTKDKVENMETTGFNYTWNTTELTGMRQNSEQYDCSIWFAAITIAISLFLFAAAVTSLVLGIFTKAPDTLGFVSTSARDNPYVVAEVASHLDGLEAARALRDVRVRIGDVNSMGSVGHVAFASMDAEPKRVSRKRVYD